MSRMAGSMLTRFSITNNKSVVLCKRSSLLTAAPASVAGYRTRKIPGVFALPPVDWTRGSTYLRPTELCVSQGW
jgi:hypothetical protein